jgi:NADP-dependent 3-hydroxy acid dehydrogenase YdfG
MESCCNVAVHREKRMTGARTIFITGAGAGIGAATARLFAGRGWLVGASDIHAGHLEALQQELGAGRCRTFVADVRDRDAMQHAIGEFASLHGGRLDAVFANAGVLFTGPDDTLTPEQKRLQVDVNVNGVVHTFDAALPFLRQAAPGSHAVAMSSMAAEYGPPHFALYSATKFFVRGYTEALAIEHRRSGVYFSGIYVSFVDTPMVREVNYRATSIDRLGVKVTADDIASTVWRAVHGRRSHWRVGLDAKMTHYAVRLLGSWVAPVYARLTGL